MSETKSKSSAWAVRVVILSLLLFFFAVPHTLEDFTLGEPAKNGVPEATLAFVVSGLFALQGLALFWAGQQNLRGYFVHAALGIVWPLAAGTTQLPVILASSSYRSGIYLDIIRGWDDHDWYFAFSGLSTGLDNRRHTPAREKKPCLKVLHK